jgi:hypothetical protein
MLHAFLFLVALSCVAQAAEPDLLLLLPNEAAAIREGYDRGDARLAAAAERLRKSADRAMKEGPWSVTFHRPKGIPAGPHDFFSEGPYWWPDPTTPGGPYIRRDGETNPDRFVENDDHMRDMGETVLRLGTAAWLFRDARYSRRAAEVLSVWFLDAKTHMNPNLEFGQAIRGRMLGRGIGIIDTRPLIWVVQGVMLLEQSPGWDARLGEGLRKWFRSYLQWLTTSEKGLDEKKNGNNHSSWWAAQVAAYAGFVRDSALERMVWELFREYLVPHQLRADGSAPEEEARTRSLSYSAMNLDGLTMLCRLAERRGVDLWSYKTAASGSVERAVAYLAPFVRNPASWRKPQIRPYAPQSNYFLLLAGIGLRRPEYVAEQARVGVSGSAWGDVLSLLLAVNPAATTTGGRGA